MSSAVLEMIALYALTGVLNWFFHFKTPEQWEAFAAKNPYGAAGIKVLRKAGLDLPGLLRIAQPLLVKLLGKFGFKGSE